MEKESGNAIITGASIQIERGAFLVAWLNLDLGNNSGQSFGGFAIGGTGDVAAGKHAEQANLAGEFIVRVMQIAGVEKWGDLPGKTIRVRKAGFLEPITAIGHIVNDDWFVPKETFARLLKKEPEA